MNIKKISAALMTAAIISASLTMSTFASPYRFGDADGDGAITIRDVILISKKIAKYDVELNETAADYDFDGKLTTKDITAIREVLARYRTDKGVFDDSAVPSDYPESTTPDIAVNQVGYVPDAKKIAHINVPKGIKNYNCYVVDKNSNKVVYGGVSQTSSRLSDPKIYASNFDFSAVKEPGDYYIATPIGRSYTIHIQNQPYNKLQDSLTTMLYYQRCGTALDKNIVGDFFAHGVCHADASKPVRIINLFDESKKIYVFNDAIQSTADKFTGGLHDAGDYGRYTSPACATVADLLYMTKMFPNGCKTDVVSDNANEHIPDTLDEARYEMEWMLKMQTAEGGIYNRIGTQDHAAFVMPDKDDKFEDMGLYVSREMVKPTASFAGCAAACYTAFKDIDPNFANRCLAAAKKAYNYVAENIVKPGKDTEDFTSVSEGNIFVIGIYSSNTYGNMYGDYMYAAAALYRATDEEQYNAKFKELYDGKFSNYDGSALTTITSENTIGGAAIEYLLNDKADKTYQQKILSKIQNSAAGIKSSVQKNKYNSPIGEYNWSSNLAISCSGRTCAIADYFTKTNDSDQTVRYISDFILGANYSGYSFVTGFGDNASKHPHHRQSMQKSDVIVPGMVVGGINTKSFPASKAKTERAKIVGYEDNSEIYQCNEPCIYINSAYMFVVSYLVASGK